MKVVILSFSRRKLVSFLLIVISGIHIMATHAQEQSSKPNVIIVLVDDVGYGDFSCQGNPIIKTPNIDKLHHESIRLTDFHVAPMCTPTRGQLMTGLDCLRNGAMNVSSGRSLLRREIPTMADVFAANGYRTGIFGKWHLGDSFPYRPNDRGFQETMWIKSFGITSAAEYWNNDYFDPYCLHNGTLIHTKGYCTDVWFEESIKWMRAQHEHKQPFFTYLPLNAAHMPLFVPDKYRESFRNQPHNVASFFGMIVNIDENMGKLEAWLIESGLRDNTIIIFITDNGGTAGVPVFNAGMRGSKQELYEGGHRVPCFVRWPSGKLRPAGDVDGLTEIQDLLPTLIELSSLKSFPARGENTASDKSLFDGVSLAPVLRSATKKVLDRTLVTQYSRIERQHPTKGDACVMWRRWRLVNDTELYDLATDPAQTKNIAGQHADIVEKLRDHYTKWWTGVEPGLDNLGYLSVGNKAENPVQLCSSDWVDVHCDQSKQVRSGEVKNGPWNVQVEKDGEYEISLQRYPKEADLALNAGFPPVKVTDGQRVGGTALPITKARLHVADFDSSKPVVATDKATTFTVKLKAGKTQLQTWFYDANGKELCGAYYTEVRRK